MKVGSADLCVCEEEPQTLQDIPPEMPATQPSGAKNLTRPQTPYNEKPYSDAEYGRQTARICVRDVISER